MTHASFFEQYVRYTPHRLLCLSSSPKLERTCKDKWGHATARRCRNANTRSNSRRAFHFTRFVNAPVARLDALSGGVRAADVVFLCPWPEVAC